MNCIMMEFVLLCAVVSVFHIKFVRTIFDEFQFHDAMEDPCLESHGDHDGDDSQASDPVRTLGRNPVEVHVEPDSPEEPRVLGEEPVPSACPENERVGESPEATHPPMENAPCPASLADSVEPCASDCPGEGPSGPDPRVLDSARPFRRLAVVELNSDSDGEMPSSFLPNCFH